MITAAALAEIIVGAAQCFVSAARDPLDVTVKTDGTLVTRVDLAVNAWLQSALRTVLPEAAWLSEESSQDEARHSAEWTWVVDPLDGTKEFTRGIHECAIAVGLVSAGEARGGAIINPFTGLWAAAGTDGTWARSSSHTEIPGPSHTSISRTEAEDGSIAPVLPLLLPTVPIGSVAYKLLRVASGIDRMTVSVQPKSEWDICGGAALLRNRGLAMMRLDGEPLRFNQPNTRIPGGFAAGTAADVEQFHRQLRRLHQTVDSRS